MKIFSVKHCRSSGETKQNIGQIGGGGETKKENLPQYRGTTKEIRFLPIHLGYKPRVMNNSDERCQPGEPEEQ